MSIGPWQIALIVLLVLILFGRGKISELMGDVAKGIKNFRKGLSEEEVAAEQPQKPIEDKAGASSSDTGTGTGNGNGTKDDEKAGD